VKGLDLNDLPRSTREFQVTQTTIKKRLFSIFDSKSQAYAKLSKLSDVRLQQELIDVGLVDYKFRSPHEAKMAIVSSMVVNHHNRSDGGVGAITHDERDLTRSGDKVKSLNPGIREAPWPAGRIWSCRNEQGEGATSHPSSDSDDRYILPLK
jgi:hypothetical protein